MICVLCDANRVRRSSVDKSGSKKMNHCNLQQNAFMSPHDESRGSIVPVSSVFCPKPRRVSILSNNVIHPCRSHSRYLKLISFVFFFPQLSYINFPEENKNEMLNFYFVFFFLWDLTVNQEQLMYVILKPGQSFWTSFVERFLSFLLMSVYWSKLCLFDFTLL